MSSGGDAAGLVVGLFVANLAYLLGTFIIFVLLDVTTTQLFTGPFAGTASDLVSTWIVVGVLLGVVDVLAVIGFISTVTTGP